jgi:hypothetical protein
MGNEAIINFAEVGSCNVSGNCWDNACGDGKVDWNDIGICGVSITLTGTTCFGSSVTITATTAGCGQYLFANLLPGTYNIQEGQTTGYTEESATCGTVNSTACGTVSGSNTFCNVPVAACGQSAINYNFGACSTVADGKGAQANTLFWDSTAGQTLIGSLNGSSTSTALGTWLSSMFPNMYGSSAANFNGLTNAQIASYFVKDYKAGSTALNTTILATALNCYVTSSTLAGGTMASAYGFTVTIQGSGYDTYNVGANGAAFGVANNSAISILQALYYTNAQSTASGVLYGGNFILQNQASTIYASIDSAGGIV